MDKEELALLTELGAKFVRTESDAPAPPVIATELITLNTAKRTAASYKLSNFRGKAARTVLAGAIASSIDDGLTGALAFWSAIGLAVYDAVTEEIPYIDAAVLHWAWGNRTGELIGIQSIKDRRSEIATAYRAPLASDEAQIDASIERLIGLGAVKDWSDHLLLVEEVRLRN